MTPPKINTADGEFVKFCRKSDKFGYTYSFFPCFSYLAPETTANMPGRRFCRRKRNLPGNNPSEGGTTRKQDSPGTGVPKTGLLLPDGRTVRIKGATLKDEAKAEVKRNITENKRKSTEAYEKGVHHLQAFGVDQKHEPHRQRTLHEIQRQAGAAQRRPFGRAGGTDADRRRGRL